LPGTGVLSKHMGPRDVEKLTLYWTAAQRAVSAFLRTLIPDPDKCQDLLQQVAVVVVRKFHEFDRSRSFNAWTIGIAKQEVLAFRRRQHTDRLVFSDAMVERIAETYQCVLADKVSDAADALEHCVQKLGGRANTVIGLHYSDGLKTVEIAQRLQMEHGTVRMLLSRARKILRECIERQLGRSVTRP
jgi:RNA polymerase sigma-70 factor, ECF subfamily